MPIKIEASQRLLSVAGMVKKLMARATPVTKVAEAGYKDITRLMLRKGYHTDTKQSKAFYELLFYKTEVRDDKDYHREFEVNGWHGESGRYGPEKTVFELFDRDKGAKPVVTIGVINEDNVNEKKQQETIKKMLDYLEHHA